MAETQKTKGNLDTGLLYGNAQNRLDDDGGAAAQDSGRLEAERLAAAGGQHEQRIAAIEDSLHRVVLERTKGREAPVFQDDFFEVVEHSTCRGNSYIPME